MMKRYRTKEQIEQARKLDADLRAGRICCACGRAFSDKVKRDKDKTDCCEQCAEAFD